MKTNKFITGIVAATAVFTVSLAPVAANAQNNRQKHKNEWRNLSLAGGGVALLGILKGDSLLTFAGAAGGLYSAYRYEQDRKSQRKEDRARAETFSRGRYTRNGHTYVKKTVMKGGKKYYQFVRVN